MFEIFIFNISSSGIRVAGTERDNGVPHYDRFPSQNDEFDEIEEVMEEYSMAPLFQRIHISGDDTTGVRFFSSSW